MCVCVCLCVCVRVCVCVCVCMILRSSSDVRGMGVVAGAVVCVSFGVLLIILTVWLVFRKKEMKKYEEEETPNEIRCVCTVHHVFRGICHLEVMAAEGLILFTIVKWNWCSFWEHVRQCYGHNSSECCMPQKP